MDQHTTTRLNDPISSDRAAQLANDLQHQKSRVVIKEVVEEYVGSSNFADRIKSILLEALEADPARNKLKDWVTGVIDSHLSEKGYKRRAFVWPLVISIIGAAAAIAAVFVTIFN